MKWIQTDPDPQHYLYEPKQFNLLIIDPLPVEDELPEGGLHDNLLVCGLMQHLSG